MSSKINAQDAGAQNLASGSLYIDRLLKFLARNKLRLAQPPPHLSRPEKAASVWQQAYTLTTLGLDPNSAPLNPKLTAILSLGFAGGEKAPAPPAPSIRPLVLRLPPDRLLFLLLKFQESSLRSQANIGDLDQPIPDGVQVVSQGGGLPAKEGDVRSVASWSGSLRSAFTLGPSGSTAPKTANGSKSSSSSWWKWKKEQELDEDAKLRIIYAAFTILPSLTIHRPNFAEPPIQELTDSETYNAYGGLDVKVPLNAFRSLWSLELEGYDPRGVIIPVLPSLKSLTVRDLNDGDWLEDVVSQDRLPSLVYLALPSINLLTFPNIEHSSIVHLDLSSNLLNAIPHSLSSLTALRSLNLANNMIESLRGCEHILTQGVRAVNLRNNRIDCLAGLDRVQSLQRIDLRHNELRESSEVGRLAQIPDMEEIWCGTDNEFVDVEEDWRVRIFTTFAAEGHKKLTLDGDEPSWSEQRVIKTALERNGQHARRPRTAEHASPSTANQSSEPSHPYHTNSAHASKLDQPHCLPTPDIMNRRRRQRIIDLDEPGVGATTNSLRDLGLAQRPEHPSNLPSPASAPIAKDLEPTQSKATRRTSIQEVLAEAQKEDIRPAHLDIQRENEGSPPEANDAQAVRDRIEALRAEVGDNWLRVFAGQQASTQAPATERPSSRNHESPDDAVIVVKKSKKKKKAVGDIT